MLSDEVLLVTRSGEEAKEGKYTIVNWAEDSGYVRKATFEEVIKYCISDMSGYDKDEVESARAIAGYLEEQRDTSKIFKIFTYDANRQRMAGFRSLVDKAEVYIFTRPLHDDDGSAGSADFLEMAVRLESPVGRR